MTTTMEKPKAKKGRKPGSITALIKTEESNVIITGDGTPGYAASFNRAVGRPRKWESPKKFHTEMQAYFMHCDVMRKKPSKAGMYLYLGTSRESISEYEEREGFVESIKAAYQAIEEAWVGRLDEPAPTGAIFYLKNAYARIYRDKHEFDHNTKGEVVVGIEYIIPGQPRDVAESFVIEAPDHETDDSTDD